MGWPLESLLRNVETKLIEEDVDLAGLYELIQKKNIKSQLIFDDFDSFRQKEVYNTLKNRAKRHNKSVFIKDFEYYVSRTCSKINQEVLNDFYQVYVNQDWINSDEFVWSLRHYLHAKNIWDSSFELICALETISNDENLFEVYLDANFIFRYVRNVSFSKSPTFYQTFKETPLRYILHMYIDLVSTFKKDNVNIYKCDVQSIISNNFFKMNQNGQKKRYRNFAFLN